jgi:hypothetical protein
MKEQFDVDVPGKFGSAEVAILDYLYKHPESISTARLVEILKPENKTGEQQKLAFDEIQDGVETLIANKLVKGKRVSQSGRIEFVQLRLTAKGEAEAIKQKRRLKKIRVTVSEIGSK